MGSLSSLPTASSSSIVGVEAQLVPLRMLPETKDKLAGISSVTLIDVASAGPAFEMVMQ